MTIKTYEAPGMMEWHPVFVVGRTRLQLPFVGGHFCGGATCAATFQTSDPVVQKIIENSVAFKSDKIVLRGAKSE